MSQVTRYTATPSGYVIATMQAQVDAMVANMRAGNPILAADVVSLINTYNDFAAHTHASSDLRGVDTYGNLAVYGTGTYTTSYSYRPSTTAPSTVVSRPITEDTSLVDITFKPDGTAMYLTHAGSGSQIFIDRSVIHQYSLSTPWDVTAITHVSSFQLNPTTAVATGTTFKPDGTYMYVSLADGTIRQYALNTPWNVASAVILIGKDITAQNTYPSDVEFNSTGTIMYTSGLVGHAIYQYSLSTPWNISTATFVTSFNTTTQEQDPTGIWIDPTGTHMYVTGQVSNAVHEYSLSTPGNVASAVYVASRAVADDNPNGVFLSPTGMSMFVMGAATSTLFTYALGDAWHVVSTSYTLTHPVVPIPTGVAADSDVSYADINTVISLINTLRAHTHVINDTVA